MSEKINPTIFKNKKDFRNWLELNHNTSSEVWVGFYKKNSGKHSITYQEALDEALCFGWIDGIRKSIDTNLYTNRFTPRRKGSNWSNVNLNKVSILIELGLMHQSGIEAFEIRDIGKSNTYSFENENKAFSEQHFKIFKSNDIAWQFFEKQSPSYKKTCIHWVNSAKLPQTKLNRLTKLIAASIDGIKIY